MLYHYFGGKQELYLACLERVYSRIRAEERNLNLKELEPLEAIERLVQFTFDHMRNNPDFVRMAGVENTQGGSFIKKLPLVANAAVDLIETIEVILERGAGAGLFRKDIDAFPALHLNPVAELPAPVQPSYAVGDVWPECFGRPLARPAAQARLRAHTLLCQNPRLRDRIGRYVQSFRFC